MTKILLDAGARLASHCRELHTSLIGSRYDIANLILDRLQPPLQHNRIGRSPIQNFASHVQGDPTVAVAMLKRLIAMGEDINEFNFFGSVLHLFILRCSSNDTGVSQAANSCFQYLLSLPNCLLDEKLEGMGTPLNFAIRCNVYNIAEQLISLGCDVRNCVLDFNFKFTKNTIHFLKMLFYAGFDFPESFQSEFRPKDEKDAEEFDSFCSWLHSKRQQVRPLKELLRIWYLNTYGVSIGNIIKYSPLPSSLIDYLTLNDIV